MKFDKWHLYSAMQRYEKRNILGKTSKKGTKVLFYVLGIFLVLLLVLIMDLLFINKKKAIIKTKSKV